MVKRFYKGGYKIDVILIGGKCPIGHFFAY